MYILFFLTALWAFPALAQIVSAPPTTGEISSAISIPGYGNGCTLSNNAVTPNTIVDISVCNTADDIGGRLMTAVVFTKTTGAWAVGTGNGGLDTGAVANSTWYYVYQIQRSDTGVVDYLMTATFGSPTMPTNYNRKRYIGAIKTDGSGNIIPFTQIGNYFMWATPVLDINAASVGTSRALQTLTSLPAGFNVQAHIRAAIFKAAAAPKMLLQNPAEADAVPGAITGNADLASQVAGTGYYNTLHVFTNTARQIAARSDLVTTSLWIVTLGWRDPQVVWPH